MEKSQKTYSISLQNEVNFLDKIKKNENKYYEMTITSTSILLSNDYLDPLNYSINHSIFNSANLYNYSIYDMEYNSSNNTVTITNIGSLNDDTNY